MAYKSYINPIHRAQSQISDAKENVAATASAGSRSRDDDAGLESSESEVKVKGRICSSEHPL